MLSKNCSRLRPAAEVQVIDGGTAGMELLESLEDVDKLIIIDCVRVGQPPATVIRRIDDEVPNFFRMKISPHQIGISDVLAALTCASASRSIWR